MEALAREDAHGGVEELPPPIFSALLATVGAIVSFLGGHTQNEALLYKSEAVRKKTEASNMWNYYQAKSTKQNLAEFAAGLATGPRLATAQDSSSWKSCHPPGAVGLATVQPIALL